MAMISRTGARRLYSRGGSLVLCYAAGGANYFGPKAAKGKAAVTKLTKDDQVTVEVLAKAGGVARVQVTQVVDSGKPIVEIWTEKNVVFQPRAEKEAKAS